MQIEKEKYGPSVDDKYSHIIFAAGYGRNLAAYKDITGEDLNLSSRASRASIRVTTKNTLPLIAKLGDRKWALTGLGSRGFTYAPLLAEALISKICNDVMPLENALIHQIFRGLTLAD